MDAHPVDDGFEVETGAADPVAQAGAVDVDALATEDLGLGSYKTAWLLLQKLRRAMVDPDRSLLEGVVEIDETDIPLRQKDDPPAGGQGRSPVGKMLLAGAVELSPEGWPRRIRLAPITDFSAASLRPFVGAVAAPGATVITDG